MNPVGSPVVPVGFEIVVEWENARLSDLARTRRMLAALCSQLRELQLPVAPRAWFLYDPGEIDPGLIREVLAECVDATDGAAFEAALRPAAGLRYYALKNLGAQLCEQPVVVFIDSDVVPEPGWLRSLLEPFARRDVEVVGGSAYVEPDSVYARGFALFWFFPLREARSDLVPAEHFFANNVAFRRGSLLARSHASQLRARIRL